MCLPRNDSYLASDRSSGRVEFCHLPPDPKWQPQDRVKKLQLLWKRERHHISLTDQMDFQLGQPVGCTLSQQETRQAAAGRSKQFIAGPDLAGYGLDCGGLEPAQ